MKSFRALLAAILLASCLWHHLGHKSLVNHFRHRRFRARFFRPTFPIQAIRLCRTTSGRAK